MKLKFKFYLMRQGISLENFVKIHEINSYTFLCDYLQSISIAAPKEEEVEHVFPKQSRILAERPVSDEKKKVSRTAGTSTSPGRSTTRKRTRKSTGNRTKPRKKNVDTT